MKLQISHLSQKPLRPPDSNQNRDSQAIGWLYEKVAEGTLFPQRGGILTYFPKVDGTSFKTRRFYTSAHKVTIQFYKEGQTEDQVLLSLSHPSTCRASWPEIAQVPASVSTNAWPGLHKRHGRSWKC